MYVCVPRVRACLREFVRACMRQCGACRGRGAWAQKLCDMSIPYCTAAYRTPVILSARGIPTARKSSCDTNDATLTEQ